MPTLLDGRILSSSSDSLTVRFDIAAEAVSAVKIDLRIDHKIDLEKLNKAGRGEFPDGSFLVLPCFSGADRSNSFCEIRSKASGRIGWIVPVNYFDEPELYYEQDFLVDFAYAALRQSLTNPSINSLSNIVSIIEGKLDGASFTSLFNGIMSFCVISKDKIDDFQPDDIYFALKHQGVFLVSKPSDLEVCSSFFEDAKVSEKYTKLFVGNWDDKINLKLSSEIVRRDIGIFQKLIGPSALQVHSPWTFLSYYQVLELLIEDVLAKEVKSIATQGFSAWKLKEKLQEISGEKKRLHIVSQSARNASQTVFKDLHQACKSFLVACKVDDSGHDNWVSSMYACRNLLVHNQMIVYRENALDELLEINIHMMKAVLEVMFHYS